MNQEQLDQIHTAGTTLGCHSLQHISFNELTPEEINEQLHICSEWFQEMWGEVPRTLAYPYGHCLPEAQEVVNSLFPIALAVEPLPDFSFHLAVPRMPAIEELNREGFQLHLNKYDLSHFAPEPIG